MFLPLGPGDLPWARDPLYRGRAGPSWWPVGYVCQQKEAPRAANTGEEPCCVCLIEITFDYNYPVSWYATRPLVSTARACDRVLPSRSCPGAIPVLHLRAQYGSARARLQECPFEGSLTLQLCMSIREPMPRMDLCKARHTGS